MVILKKYFWRALVLLGVIFLLLGCRPWESSLPQEAVENDPVLENHVSKESSELKKTSEDSHAKESAIKESLGNASGTATISQPIISDEESRFFSPGGTIIFQKDGFTLFHYFPNVGSLHGDESEILGYHSGEKPIRFTSANMLFIAGGKTYEQYSGTWEKFPSFQSWERLEYINIEPDYYQKEPLVLQPGEKGKLHWHYRFEGELGKEQAVNITLTFLVGEKEIALRKILVREDFTASAAGADEGHSE